MQKFKVLITDYAWPDLDMEREILAAAGAELVVAERSGVDDLVRLARGVDAIMTTWAKTPEPVIAAATDCRIVARFGIGLDNIDVGCCTRLGIPVTNVPDYCLAEVAEHTLALVLALARKVAHFHHETQQGGYDRQSGPPLRRIEGQTLGIIGLGNIGRRVAEKASALGLNVTASTRTCHNNVGRVQFLGLDELLGTSDYVSLHLPLNAGTHHLIGAEQLAKMKPSAYLINTARGGLIDHAALAAALADNQLAGAALDVQDPEPPDLSQPPFNDPRVIVTPHAAFLSEESLRELRTRAARQVAARLTGNVPENVVNPSVLGRQGLSK